MRVVAEDPTRTGALHPDWTAGACGAAHYSADGGFRAVDPAARELLARVGVAPTDEVLTVLAREAARTGSPATASFCGPRNECVVVQAVCHDGGVVLVASDATPARRARAFEAEHRNLLAAIAAGADAAQVLAGAALMYERRFPGTYCVVLQVDPATLRVRGAIGPSMPQDYLGSWVGIVPGPEQASCGPAIHRRQRVVVADIASDPLWADSRAVALARGLRACWSQPAIASDGRVLATFAVSYGEPRGPTTEEVAGIESMAALVSLALERANDARALQQSRQRFQSLFERSPHPVLAFGLDGRVVDCNERALAWSRRTREQAVGRDLASIAAPESVAEVTTRFAAACAGEPQSFAASITLRALGRREVEASLVPTVVDGEVVGVFCIIEDITERREVEAERDLALARLEVRNRELQDFIFIASHDLQEPLRKIRVFSDRVLEAAGSTLDLRARDDLARAEAAATRMQALLNDLLSYARVTSSERQMVELDLAEVARDALAELEASASDIAAVRIGELPRVEGDRMQIQQLFANLLSNALKYRHAGRPPIVLVDTLPDRTDTDHAAFIVEDNGIGFESAQSERIFAPFQRLHGRDAYPGNGIGLAIVRRVVERHDGWVAAVGRPGDGARFEVVLPRRQRA